MDAVHFARLLLKEYKLGCELAPDGEIRITRRATEVFYGCFWNILAWFDFVCLACIAWN